MLGFVPKRILNMFLSSKPFRGDQEFKSKENYKYSSGSTIKDIKAMERAGNCYVLVKILNEYSTVCNTQRTERNAKSNFECVCWFCTVVYYLFVETFNTDDFEVK